MDSFLSLSCSINNKPEVLLHAVGQFWKYNFKINPAVTLGFKFQVVQSMEGF
jgi:hypothetical protein